MVTTDGVSNPDANTYTPVADDVGYFLRATASYDDGQGDDKDEDMVSYLAVRAIPYSNTDPVFLDAEGEDLTSTERDVAEDAEPGDPVGDPVIATDAAETGPDVLTYTLDPSSVTFAIDSGTGQIKVGPTGDLDFEATTSDTVTVKATDPSGLNDTVQVTINVTDVDETPVVTGDTEIDHDENQDAFNPVQTYTADDEEDNNSDLMWSLSGADKDSFEISPGGVLTFESAPDYENPGDANRDNDYEVTVHATDSGANTGTLDVTVTVEDVEEDGTVTLSNLQPEDGTVIIATLEDLDGGETGVTWQWAKAPAMNGNYTDIDDATSPTYKPVGNDVGDYLRATATYTDGFGEDTAEGISANAVQQRLTQNSAPEFKDADDDALTSVDREVAENTTSDSGNPNVGDPVVAMPVDTGALTYSLQGRDARSFDIDPANGQIKVGESADLDFETKTRYSVTVRVVDAQNAPDTVTVNIMVTNVEEPPEITGGPMMVDFAENGTGTAATYTAADDEDDHARPREALSWSVGGTDDEFFSIDAGVLEFNAPPDFEDAQDDGSNNVYEIEVIVTDSNDQTNTQPVMVEVTNVEEPGEVTLSVEQPQEDIQVTATLTDPDNITADSTTWQWARSRSRSSGWVDIEDDANIGKAATYTPAKADVGYYLRATATYKDGESTETEKSAEDGSTHTVRKTPYMNAAPVFQNDEGEEIPTGTGVERSVAENSRVGTAVGDPVAATDPGDGRPDVLTYSLGGTDAGSLDIDSGTGQIRVKAGEIPDYEDSNNTDHQFVVEVTAKDPSDTDSDQSRDTITVTIMVTNVDEFPGYTSGPTEVDHDEENSTATATYVPAVATYVATDPEDQDDTLKWSLSGIDGNKFLISISTTGALTFMTPPDHEKPVDSGRNNVYNVTVEVTDSNGYTSARAVTVTVDDIEEGGTVTLSHVQPEDGVDIRASLDDPDGSVSGVTWQWAWNSSDSVTPQESDHIEDAMSATYRPVLTYVGRYLYAIASYTDGQGANKMAFMVSDNMVQAADTFNEEPEFPDLDPDTEGDQTDQTREVPENAEADTNVGDRVTATDPDGERLMYELGGADQDSFDIDRTDGQITVREGTVLNFESKDTYTVTVTASDAQGADASITVTITVTDVDEPPELSQKALVVVGDERVDYLENGTDAVETYTAAGPDSVGARWSLSGTDSGRFGLSGGVLSFRSSPNYEAPTDSDSDNVYEVVVRATKGSLQDERTVTIKVINLDETGSISLSNQQPGVGVQTVATLTDPDGGITGERWQWARSPDGSTRWSDIQGATAATYAPVLADAEHYLRVTVTYTDAQGGGKSTDAVTSGATSVDDDGVVTLSSSTPQVGVELTASLRDPDGGVTGEAWQWARSEDGASNWEDIVTATSNAYTPVAADEGNYLRATVSYTDGDGPGKGADAVSANVVAANTAPEFPASETGARSVSESAAAGANIGAPVAAGDTPGDTLTYTLGGADAASFDIVATSGQLQTKAALDSATKSSYVVTVTATDTSGASATITVTINVVAANTAPEFPASETGARSVSESAAAGANIGAPVAAGDTPGDTLTYTLGGADAASFDIVATSGQLQTKAALDSATKSSYVVTVTATDTSGASATITVTINVVAANTAPEFPASETGARSVSESAAAGANIGAPVAAGDTPGDTLTYTLGGADAASFDIVATSGQLQTKAALDSATKSSYVVTVTATDTSGASATITVTINVVAANTAPEFPASETGARSVSESAAAGANIGAPVAAGDTPGDTLTYTLGGADAASFDIVATSGQLQTKAALDSATKSSYVVTVTATDTSGASATITVTINVVAANTAPEFPASETGARSVSESAAAGANIGAPVAAGDTPGDTLTYTLGGADAASFDIVATSGQLQTKAALDSATKSSYVVTVTATDTSGASATITVTINVVAENTPPVFPASETGARSVPEGTVADTDIGAPVEAEDPGDTLTYTLGGTDAASFDIVATSGQLQTKAALDSATKSSYVVTVTATDTSGASATITVTINVVAANTAPEFPASETGARSVSESAAAGANIGAPVAAGDTPGDTLTYTLGGADAASFDIVATSGQLQTKAALDSATKSSYVVTVTATDTSGASATITVTINVVAANTAPEFPASETGARSVSESAAAGANIGAPVAAGDTPGDTLTYTLGGADAASFDIVATSGQLQTKAALDSATKSSYVVTVTATDTSGASATITVTINVVAENTPPLFPASETGARSVSENASAGTDIGAPVAARDPGDTLTYTLGGTDAASFDIVAATGQLQTKVALDAATKSSYTVTVTATDTAGESATITVTITVTCSTLGELGDRYDANNDCSIDRLEVIEAIKDYFADRIDRLEVIKIIRLYFTT